MPNRVKKKGKYEFRFYDYNELEVATLVIQKQVGEKINEAIPIFFKYLSDRR